MRCVSIQWRLTGFKTGEGWINNIKKSYFDVLFVKLISNYKFKYLILKESQMSISNICKGIYCVFIIDTDII